MKSTPFFVGWRMRIQRVWQKFSAARPFVLPNFHFYDRPTTMYLCTFFENSSKYLGKSFNFNYYIAYILLLFICYYIIIIFLSVNPAVPISNFSFNFNNPLLVLFIFEISGRIAVLAGLDLGCWCPWEFLHDALYVHWRLLIRTCLRLFGGGL